MNKLNMVFFERLGSECIAPPDRKFILLWGMCPPYLVPFNNKTVDISSYPIAPCKSRKISFILYKFFFYNRISTLNYLEVDTPESYWGKTTAEDRGKKRHFVL